MKTRRSAPSFERTVTVRVGPDAWEWLSAADRSGRVGGHFRGGLNAVFGSEALVCPQSPSVPIHPWALVADLPWEEVEERALVTASGGRLSVGRFVLSLAEAQVVDLTFHPPAELVSLEALQERVALIEQLLAESPDPFASAFDRAFVCDRDRILAEWQETGDPAVLLPLIGRGPGTTPAGDDTLIGLLAGLEVLSAVAPDPATSRLQATRRALLAALPKARTSNPELPPRQPQATCHMPQASLPTSALSAQLLKSATSGRFPTTLLELQLTLLDGQTKIARLVHAASDALSIGQTTGRAVLDGLAAVLSFRGMLAGQSRAMCHRKHLPLAPCTTRSVMEYGMCPWNPKHPGPDREFALWCRKKKIRWIGVDCGSADHPMNTIIRDWMPRQAREADAHFKKKYGKPLAEFFDDSKYQLMHLELFNHGIIHAECLGGDIDLLLNERVQIGCFPWRFVDGESSISRIVAFLDDKAHAAKRKEKETCVLTKFGDVAGAENPALHERARKKPRHA